MAQQPDPFPSLLARIKRLEQALHGQQNSSAFAGTGVHPNGNQGLDSDNYVHGVSGFSLNGVTGVPEFKDILLYDLPNSMLANPVIPGIARLSASAFSLSTSYATLDSGTLTVPDDCTKLFVTVFARLYVVNTNTSGGGDGFGLEAIYVKGIVGGNASVASPTGVSGSNGFATTFGNDAFLITGLTPGGTMSFAVQGKCAYSGIPSYSDNFVVATAALSWSR